MIQFKPEEMTNIMKDFDEPGTLAPTGLFLASAKYMVIQGEPGAVIRGKKVRKSWDQSISPLAAYKIVPLIIRQFALGIGRDRGASP